MGPWPSRRSNGLPLRAYRECHRFSCGFHRGSKALRVSPATFRHERTGGLFACFTTFATLVFFASARSAPASTVRELLHALSCK